MTLSVSLRLYRAFLKAIPFQNFNNFLSKGLEDLRMASNLCYDF